MSSTVYQNDRTKQGMVWMDSGDNQAALACFEEACTVDGANASVHFCRAVALVKVQAPTMADLHLPLCQPNTADALVGCARSCGAIMHPCVEETLESRT